MGNPIKGEVDAKLADGRTIKLLFDANAWIEAEELLGKPVQDILDEISSGRASLKTQRAIIFGALREHHPEMTERDAGKVLIEAAEAMAKGIEGAMPPAEAGAGAGDGEAGDDATAHPRKRRAGTGTSS